MLGAGYATKRVFSMYNQQKERNKLTKNVFFSKRMWPVWIYYDKNLDTEVNN